MTADTPSLGAVPPLPELTRAQLFTVWDEHYTDLLSCDRPSFDPELLRAAIAAAGASRAQSEPEGWRSALQFYAERAHFAICDDSAWDTVSGEPSNFWCDEAGTATVEDGTVAAMALAGTPLPDEDDEPATLGETK